MPKLKTGSVYLRGATYWVKFYVPGQSTPIRESTKTEDYAEAERYLHRRLGELATGKFAGLEPERIKVNALFDFIEEDYEQNDRASFGALKSRLKLHLRPYFGSLRAAEVGTRQITAYKTKRKRAGAKNATINRELEVLRHAFLMGFEAEPQLVSRPLKVEKLTEDNVREGLLEHSQYLVLRDGLPEPYRTFFVCAYYLGTRAGELAKLQWSQVDFERNEITLLRYTTKTKKQRVLPMMGDMRAFLEMAKAKRDQEYPDCPWVFTRDGRKKFVFVNRVWHNQVKALGVPRLLFHDLRRTAVTNMIEAGLSEKEAMEISGHTTDRIFRRYQIVRRHRIQALGQKLEGFYQGLTGTITGTTASAAVPN